jgi:hypothetical protein
MYESLYKVCPDFRLFVFAFDDSCYQLLCQMVLPQMTVISLKEFEDEQLLRIKPSRSKAEYCWTCTPSTLLYCLDYYRLDHCTYIDADLFFFKSPQVLIDEMGDKDVMITDHRYSPQYDQTALSGKYCVQFMVFRNTANGRKILLWWRNACLDWCYARKEEGKFGDQKYLDDWTIRFEGVHELTHLGGGIAPWNVQQYELFEKSGCLLGRELITGEVFDVIFYHVHYLHNYRIKFIQEFYFGHYILSKQVLRYIYMPYLQELKKQDRLLSSSNAAIDSLGTQTQAIGWIRLLGHLLKNLSKPNRINWIRTWHN